MLPSYVGMKITHYFGSLLTNQDFMESRRAFFAAKIHPEHFVFGLAA